MPPRIIGLALPADNSRFEFRIIAIDSPDLSAVSVNFSVWSHIRTLTDSKNANGTIFYVGFEWFNLTFGYLSAIQTGACCSALIGRSRFNVK